jgi:CRISPR-associated exonuclease Cas4
MGYSDEDLLPISALQHLAFCERQCALIHVEREWAENDRTAEGKVVHERVDEGYRAYRKGLKQFAGVQVCSRSLGISGKLDMLELTQVEGDPDNCTFLHLKGYWQIQPVEFKRGKPKKNDIDRVQVCAQALCLEEMTGTQVERGSIFYAQLRRRTEVDLDDVLRRRTLSLIHRLREVVEGVELPPPVLKRHCQSCSLQQICQPSISSGAKTAAYRRELFG